MRSHSMLLVSVSLPFFIAACVESKDYRIPPAAEPNESTQTTGELGTDTTTDDKDIYVPPYGTSGDDLYDYGWGGAGGANAEEIPPFNCRDERFFPWRGADAGGASGQAEPSNVAWDAESDQLGTGDLTVLVVFDKSGSMTESWGGKSRWQAGSDAFLLGLDGIEQVVTIGALFFPFADPVDPSCGVGPIETSPQVDFRAGGAFKASWFETACTAQPNGSTPLERALLQADQAINSAEERGLLAKRFRVILITDGEPTCNDDREQILSYPASWAEMGIDTHVIGLPGSESATTLLTQIAQAGGTDAPFIPAAIGETDDEAMSALDDEVFDLLR